MSTSTVHIAIEAHVGDDEIRGQIRSDTAPPGSFSGWLGLIGALDALLSPRLGADDAGGVQDCRALPAATVSGPRPASATNPEAVNPDAQQ